MFTDLRLQPLTKAAGQPKLRFQTGDLVRPRTEQATLCEVLSAEGEDRIRVRGLDWSPGYSAILLVKEIHLVSRVSTEAFEDAD